MSNLITASFQKIKVISEKGDNYIFGYIQYCSSFFTRILNHPCVIQLFTNDRLCVGDILSANNKQYEVTAFLGSENHVGVDIYAISESE